MTPLAVANINLASLYDCKPKSVSTIILISTIGFMPIVIGFINIPQRSKLIIIHFFTHRVQGIIKNRFNNKEWNLWQAPMVES